MGGTLIGLLFLAPLFGMAIGAATGAVAGKMTDVGVDDTFIKALGDKRAPGRGGADRARPQLDARSACSSACGPTAAR